MTNSQRLATVRAHLLRWLQENVAPKQLESDTALVVANDTVEDQGQVEVAENPADSNGDCTQIISESILIRDGFYAGRTFEASAQGESFRATWFMEPDELKIHASGGVIVAVFQGDEIPSELLDDADATDDRPISIPMSAAGESPQPQSDADSDDDRIQKAA